MQSLFLGDNQWITIDRMFVDGGTPAKMAMVGGHQMELAPAIPAKPDILMAGGGFYHRDRQPVTKLEDVAHVPEPYHTQAEVWIKAAGKAKPKPLAVVVGATSEQGQPIPPDRGRSLRGQAPHRIDSPEQADRELLGPGGLREIERA